MTTTAQAIAHLKQVQRDGLALYGTVVVTREEWERMRGDPTRALVKAKIENAFLSVWERALEMWG